MTMRYPSESNHSAELAALRGAGADQFDPVQLHFMEALQRRTLSHSGQVQQILERKLDLALAAYKTRFAQAEIQSGETITATHSTNRTSLRDLVDTLEQHSHGTLTGSVQGQAAMRPELKSIRHFRNTWSKLSVDKQLSQALGQAPKNAGPINSHMLVLRSLALMRDLSPDYLHRFMSYADTLLCLDKYDQELHFSVKKTSVAKPVMRKTAPDKRKRKA
jgi:hypothetical protein